MNDIDKVFKALADPSRRELIDRLHKRGGQTLNELCDRLDMARQSVTQHLGLLEDANLISVEWRGREKLHYFNPVPIHAIYVRWIRKLEVPHLEALHEFKTRLERKPPWAMRSSSTPPISPPRPKTSGKRSSKAG